LTPARGLVTWAYTVWLGAPWGAANEFAPPSHYMGGNYALRRLHSAVTGRKPKKKRLRGANDGVPLGVGQVPVPRARRAHDVNRVEATAALYRPGAGSQRPLFFFLQGLREGLPWTWNLLLIWPAGSSGALSGWEEIPHGNRNRGPADGGDAPRHRQGEAHDGGRCRAGPACGGAVLPGRVVGSPCCLSRNPGTDDLRHETGRGTSTQWASTSRLIGPPVENHWSTSGAFRISYNRLTGAVPMGGLYWSPTSLQPRRMGVAEGGLLDVAC